MFFTVKSPKQSVQGSDIRSLRTVADSYANFSEYLENRVLDLASGVVTLAEHGINSADGDDVQTHCVLLSAGGEDPPQKLSKLLDQPNTHTVKTAHPLLAAAELTSLNREIRARKAWKEAGSEERLILVVAKREDWSDLSALFNMVRMFMPDVSIWVCTGHYAMEIYSGSNSEDDQGYHDDDEPGDDSPDDSPGDSPFDPDPSPPDPSPSTPEEPALPSSEMTEEEIRLILELYDSDDNSANGQGPSNTPGEQS
jgi:hypothetical protein